MQIRDAAATDLAAIMEIYNEVAASSTAIFSDVPVTLQERARWWQERRDQGFPVIVAEEKKTVIGFASYGSFRASPGYRHTVEHTVHVHEAWRGQRAGSLLMMELIFRAREAGVHAMVGAVDAENAASLRFHERLGFERAALLKEVGWKFGQWLDLVLVEMVLGETAQK